MRVSPVMGCNVGSMQTSLQTFDSQSPTVSQTSLCLMEGKPPFGQESACSTVKWVPQAQLVGTFEGSQPYLKAIASLNVPLWSENP